MIWGKTHYFRKHSYINFGYMNCTNFSFIPHQPFFFGESSHPQQTIRPDGKNFPPDIRSSKRKEFRLPTSSRAGFGSELHGWTRLNLEQRFGGLELGGFQLIPIKSMNTCCIYLHFPSSNQRKHVVKYAKGGFQLMENGVYPPGNDNISHLEKKGKLSTQKCRER